MDAVNDFLGHAKPGASPQGASTAQDQPPRRCLPTFAEQVEIRDIRLGDRAPTAGLAQHRERGHERAGRQEPNPPEIREHFVEMHNQACARTRSHGWRADGGLDFSSAPRCGRVGGHRQTATVNVRHGPHREEPFHAAVGTVSTKPGPDMCSDPGRHPQRPVGNLTAGGEPSERAARRQGRGAITHNCTGSLDRLLAAGRDTLAQPRHHGEDTYMASRTTCNEGRS